MQIIGKWQLCDDGVTRPVVTAEVLGADNLVATEDFLIDIGADSTVLSAGLLKKLQLPDQSSSSGISLRGIGGSSPFVIVATVLEFTREDGGRARVRGTIAAFTDPGATDLSVLGRDVLDQFDVIISRPRNQVLLLSGNHTYSIAAR